LKFVELFQGYEKRKEYESQYEDNGIRYGDLKTSLAEAIFAELEPIQKKRLELEADPEYVDRVIAEGAEKARKVAAETVAEVRQKMGLA
jgi:tryptophanyl-tRNA synthetase